MTFLYIMDLELWTVKRLSQKSAFLVIERERLMRKILSASV